MSAIARLLAQQGAVVSGSDCKPSPVTDDLARLGVTIYPSHEPAHVHGAAEVVISSAIRPGNPEWAEAVRLGIPVIHRATKLASLFNASRGIAIAGTHGKTTTSSMTATALTEGGASPTYAIGGYVNLYGRNAELGSGPYFVIEADESDGSLVQFRPEIAVLTNVELDHTDYYKSMDQLDGVVREFLAGVPAHGAIVWCADDLGARRLMENRYAAEAISYAQHTGADYTASNVVLKGLGSTFDVSYKGTLLGRAALHVPGSHNVTNALAVIAVALRAGLSFEQAAAGLAAFTGVQRRFQIWSCQNEVTVVDDYAHHPSEIRATLSAARASDAGRIISVFQPHRYSRTASLAEDFGDALSSADTVVVTDIYGAGEDPIPLVTSDLIVQSMHRRNPQADVRLISGLDAVTEFVASIARPHDLVITLGAGDVWKVARGLTERARTAATLTPI